MGMASLIRLLLVAKRKFDRLTDEAIEEHVEMDIETSGIRNGQKFECSLCFDNAFPVSTPCGHAFCWNCIERTKESCDTIGVLQCPTCRFQFENNRAVPLMNM